MDKMAVMDEQEKLVVCHYCQEEKLGLDMTRLYDSIYGWVSMCNKCTDHYYREVMNDRRQN